MWQNFPFPFLIEYFKIFFYVSGEKGCKKMGDAWDAHKYYPPRNNVHILLANEVYL